VAVLLVALNHSGASFMRGGYVGVDVFFVLSGYLITGLLLSEGGTRGRISLVGFYARRARRILPAAALTLVVTDIVAYHVMNFVRAKQVVLDSAWASVFAANIRFARVGVDYFAREQPPSPIQHFWTLAVEEQFYIVWPALLAVVLFGVRRRRRAERGEIATPALTRLMAVVAVVGAASLAWSIHETSALPAGAYFSTFTRAWELALGAVLAIGTSRFGEVPDRARAVLGWAGLACIVTAGVAFSSATPFPGYAALLPTVGAALVIAAGRATESTALSAGRMLGIAPLRFIGDRSYAFYLWHWPVLILAAAEAGHAWSVRANVGLLVAAFALSCVSYALFENPIRRTRSLPASALLWPASIAGVALVAAVSLHSIDARASQLQAGAKAAVQPVSSQTALAAAGSGLPLPSVVAAVQAAKQGEAVPTGLAPPIADLLDSKYVYEFPRGCAPHGASVTSRICRLGAPSAKKTIVFLGDSHAQVWMPSVLRMADEDKWAVLPIVHTGCSPSRWSGPFSTDECRAWFSWAVQQAEQRHPDVLLIGAAFAGNQGEKGQVIDRELISLAATARRFSKHVILIEDPPGTRQQAVDCLLQPGATLGTCMMVWGTDRFALSDELAASATSAGFGFLATRGFFCEQGYCPSVVGKTIVYRDLDHITMPYAVEMAEPFRSAFTATLRKLG
jgi:peptidoglycan/LPS O-acetylase OafA/YrhL